jgi:aspartyl-tRNA(Asn)/glutamyl-tRNA(Gln) amidotransferase subunit C
MISREEVLGLAELARLKLTDAEVENLQKDISNILDYVGQISAVSARNGAKETPSLRNVMREDAPAPVLGAREALLNALPTREGDFNVVRKIIQKDE